MTNFSRFMIAKTFSGLYFAIPIQTIFLFKLGLSFNEIMLCQAAMLFAMLLFEIPTGILGDRFGRRNSLIIGEAVNLISWIPWFMGWYMYQVNFYPFALASFFIYGIMLAFTSGSDDALIYDDLKARGKKELAQKYYGYYRGAGVLSLGVAGLIGGFMSVSHTLESFWLSYLATFIAQIVGFLLLFTVREPKRSNEGENIKHKPERVLNLFKDGLKLIRNSPSLKRITIFSMLVAPFSFILASIIQPYYELVGVPNSWWGVAIFAGSVLTFFAKTNAYRIESWFGVDKGMIIVTILPAITYALMSVVFNPILAVVLYVLTDAFGNLRDPIITDYKNQHIKSYNRATVLSTIYIISGVYAVLIRPVIGNLTDYSVSLAFGVIAAIFIFSLIFFPIKKEHVRFANDLK